MLPGLLAWSILCTLAAASLFLAAELAARALFQRRALRGRRYYPRAGGGASWPARSGAV